MTTLTSLDAIPGPAGLPFLGNIFEIDARSPVESLMRLARKHGPIFKLTVPGGTRLIVSGPDLVGEICDEARFDKLVTGGLSNLRRGPAGNGLFTSETQDPLWRRAHNILLTPFSQQSMRDYLPMMSDIAEQLMDKWERLNPGDEVDVPAEMTRLTLDTIALCGFGYRFNSFYRNTPHPFVSAMVRTLEQSQARTRQLAVLTRMKIRAQRRLEEDQAFMNDLVDKLIRERREQGAAGETRDLLGRMLTGVDRQSGQKLPDENIRAQCITFLIAGHETTSGLLSFAVYYLLKNPDVLARARAEVDEVLGAAGQPDYAQLHRLTYLTQILNEALRLWPTAPGFSRYPLEDTVLGGRYRLPKGTAITVLTPMLHRDRDIWGPDAEDFNPEHTVPQRLAGVPPHAFRPFGTGLRACIGRQFALQEATLVLGMLLRRFELIDHLDYQLTIKTTLTIKPADLRIQVARRAQRPLDHATEVAPAAPAASLSRPVPARPGPPLLVLYGSNLGTAEGIATRLAQEGTERGFAVTEGALDEYAGALPTDGAVVIVCSSYNGLPPDNAEKFCGRLRDPAAAADACAGVHYTVFGCGNTEWTATYQAVPTLLDTELAAHGATRLHPRGAGDAREDFDAQYRSWHRDLWRAITAGLGLPASMATSATTIPRLSISLVNRQLTNPVIMSYRAQPTLVRDNRELCGTNGGWPAQRSTRHLEIALPTGISYRAGDHLGVLPRNDIDLIRRVMQRFALDAGMYVTIVPTGGTHTHLPIGEPAPLLGVLGACVELQDVATRADIEVMAQYTGDPGQRAELAALAGDDEQSRARYRERVFLPHRSVLDLLDEFPGCTMPFEIYLDLLPPLHPRYYSISSSPLVSPDVCSITAGLLRTPARDGDGVFRGICSNHLAGCAAGSTVFVFVREPTIAFRPPDDPHLPIIMVAAGTGLAPFRGFLQERAALAERGVPTGESLLFFGCRDPAQDYLYSDELQQFEKLGVARVHIVFSRHADEGRKYVQHAMRANQDEVWALIERGAVIFVCGNANTMAPGVRAAFLDICRAKTGSRLADAEEWLARLRTEGRFLEDIWGS